jgi:hypothetical protein
MTAAPSLPSLEDRIFNLLKLAAKEIRPCKLCGVTLYFIEHKSGTHAPYTKEGINHFLNCPNAGEFRRQKK